jgi:uncharacterized protein YecE (DUF72 family)
MAGRILVGTSSWADPGFVEDWYPRGMAARDRLAWYAERFELVEVNSSFYAVPDVATVARWAQVTPDGFVFDYKLHRLLSRHSAPLESLPPGLRERARTTGRGRVVLDPDIERAMIEETIAAVRPLEEAGKLGALLLQLTPAFSPKDHRLDEIVPVLEGLAPRLVAVELRHRGWVEGERAADTFDFLADHGAAFVGVDAPPDDHPTIMPPVDAVTNPTLAYLRAHGRNTDGYLTGRSVAERFGWEYGDEELEEIAGRARALAEQADVVHVAFNNNRSANAPTSARAFRQKLGQDPGPAPDAGLSAVGAQLRLA